MNQSKIKVILGNITFHHFVEEELKLFKTDNEQKALIHEIHEIKEFDTIEEAYEEVDNTHYLSWLIPSEYNGEIAYDDGKRIIHSSNNIYTFENVVDGMLICKDNKELGVYTGFVLGDNLEGDYLIELALEFQQD